mmetsp:Transcript_62631/g.201984  ORF Transcript_62631/g.201984 Transcript_62631/m.201984 type:complete len:246 (-) Transcript_62631:700-1437(-)
MRRIRCSRVALSHRCLERHRRQAFCISKAASALSMERECLSCVATTAPVGRASGSAKEGSVGDDATRALAPLELETPNAGTGVVVVLSEAPRAPISLTLSGERWLSWRLATASVADVGVPSRLAASVPKPSAGSARLGAEPTEAGLGGRCVVVDVPLKAEAASVFCPRFRLSSLASRSCAPTTGAAIRGAGSLAEHSGSKSWNAMGELLPPLDSSSQGLHVRVALATRCRLYVRCIRRAAASQRA